MCQFEFSRGKGVEVNALGVMPCGLLDPCVPWNVDVYTTLLPRKTNVDTFFYRNSIVASCRYWRVVDTRLNEMEWPRELLPQQWTCFKNVNDDRTIKMGSVLLHPFNIVMKLVVLLIEKHSPHFVIFHQSDTAFSFINCYRNINMIIDS